MTSLKERLKNYITGAGTIAFTTTIPTISASATFTDDASIVNKRYVDQKAQEATAGITVLTPAAAATTAPIDLNNPGSIIDGVILQAGNRILVKDQTTKSENGVYVYTDASTTLTRAEDAKTPNQLKTAFILVNAGTINIKTGFKLSVDFNDGVTDTTTAEFTDVKSITASAMTSASSYIGKNGISISGTDIELQTVSGLTTTKDPALYKFTYDDCGRLLSTIDVTTKVPVLTNDASGTGFMYYDNTATTDKWTIKQFEWENTVAAASSGNYFTLYDLNNKRFVYSNAICMYGTTGTVNADISVNRDITFNANVLFNNNYIPLNVSDSIEYLVVKNGGVSKVTLSTGYGLSKVSTITSGNRKDEISILLDETAATSTSGLTTGTNGLKVDVARVPVLTTVVNASADIGKYVQYTASGWALSNVSGGTSYTLLTASTSTLGGITVGYSPPTDTANRNYPVKLDGSSSNAYVTIPWTDTKYTNGDGLSLGTTTNAFSIKLDTTAIATPTTVLTTPTSGLTTGTNGLRVDNTRVPVLSTSITTTTGYVYWNGSAWALTASAGGGGGITGITISNDSTSTSPIPILFNIAATTAAVSNSPNLKFTPSSNTLTIGGSTLAQETVTNTTTGTTIYSLTLSQSAIAGSIGTRLIIKPNIATATTNNGILVLTSNNQNNGPYLSIQNKTAAGEFEIFAGPVNTSTSSIRMSVGAASGGVYIDKNNNIELGSTTATTTINSPTITIGTGTAGTTTVNGTLTIAGNLTFSGSNRRILANFSDGSDSSRTIFATNHSTLNNTRVCSAAKDGAIAAGSGFMAYGMGDGQTAGVSHLDNSSFIRMVSNAIGTSAIEFGYIGTSSNINTILTKATSTSNVYPTSLAIGSTGNLNSIYILGQGTVPTAIGTAGTTAAGYVGINNSTPTAQLDVAGTFKVSGIATFDGGLTVTSAANTTISSPIITLGSTTTGSTTINSPAINLGTGTITLGSTTTGTTTVNSPTTTINSPVINLGSTTTGTTTTVNSPVIKLGSSLNPTAVAITGTLTTSGLATFNGGLTVATGTTTINSPTITLGTTTSTTTVNGTLKVNGRLNLINSTFSFGPIDGDIYANAFNNLCRFKTTTQYYIPEITAVTATAGSFIKFSYNITSGISWTTDASNYAGSSTAGGAANSVANALTFNNSGTGSTTGIAYNGSSAVTISYNSIGAAPTANPTFTGTLTAASLSLSGAATFTGGLTVAATANTVTNINSPTTTISSPTITLGSTAIGTTTINLGVSSTATTATIINLGVAGDPGTTNINSPAINLGVNATKLTTINLGTGAASGIAANITLGTATTGTTTINSPTINLGVNPSISNTINIGTSATSATSTIFTTINLGSAIIGSATIINSPTIILGTSTAVATNVTLGIVGGSGTTTINSPNINLGTDNKTFTTIINLGTNNSSTGGAIITLGSTTVGTTTINSPNIKLGSTTTAVDITGTLKVKTIDYAGIATDTITLFNSTPASTILLVDSATTTKTINIGTNSSAVDTSTTTATTIATTINIGTSKAAVTALGTTTINIGKSTNGSSATTFVTNIGAAAKSTVNILGVVNLGSTTAGTTTINSPNINLGTLSNTAVAITGTLSVTGDIYPNFGTAAPAVGLTSGFVYIPGAAGAPTGTPAARTGVVPLYFDTTNNRLYIRTTNTTTPWRYVSVIA